MKIQPDSLAYWYLRLNGFLTTGNFVLHPEAGTAQRTDVDVLAVRFPFRAELMIDPMQDDPLVLLDHDRPVVLIAEVKAGLCALNGPWTDRTQQNMQRVLRAIGVAPPDREAQVAADIYATGRSTQPEGIVSIACFGDRENRELAAHLPGVPQITWQHIADFIFVRFMTYSHQKVSHPQWDRDGLNLWQAAFKCEDSRKFRASIEF